MPVVGPPMGHPPNMGFYPGGPPPHPPQGYPMGPPTNLAFNGPPGPVHPLGDQMETMKKRQDYEALCHIINQWNANRLDLFALSLPNEVRSVPFCLRHIFSPA